MSDIWRDRPQPLYRSFAESGEADYKIPASPSDEEIMRNAREHPMALGFIGEDDQVAVGNTVDGFRYYDADGNPLRRDEAEPFRLTGTNFVIRHGLFGVEVAEEQPDDNA